MVIGDSHGARMNIMLSVSQVNARSNKTQEYRVCRAFTGFIACAMSIALIH